MKSLKLILLSCLSLCISQMQAMDGRTDVRVDTETANRATQDTVAKNAEKDAAIKAQSEVKAQHQQSNGTKTVIDNTHQAGSGGGLGKPAESGGVPLGEAEASGVKEGEKVPDSSQNIESKTLFKEEDLVTKDGELAKITRKKSQSFSQWVSSIIESLQRMISGIPKTPRIDAALQDAKESISTILKDPVLEDNDSLKRLKINNELQSLANVIAEESSLEVFQKVNQEMQSFSTDIQEGLKYFYHDAFRTSNNVADSLNLSRSQYENIPQDSSSANRYVNFDIE